MRDRWQFALRQRLLLMSAITLVGLAVLLGVSLLGTDLLRRTHADQSPPNCASNDFVLTVQKSLTYFSDTATVHYTVLAGNPNTSGAGCDVGGVTLSLTTPDGTVHALGDDLDFSIGTAESVMGGASYVPSTSAPEYNGWSGYNGVAWVAMAEATGQLLNNPVQDDPWQVRKTVSVVPASIVVRALASPPGVVAPGTEVTVTFVQTNDGVGQLESATVTSPLCTPEPVPATGPNQGDLNGNGLLDPGESWIFSCTLVVVESIDVPGAGSGPVVGTELVIDRWNDPDATAMVTIPVQSSGDPPRVETPRDDPPGDAPPSKDPPVGELPVGEPPTADPPAADPPAADPPAEEPPVDAPPSEDPPAADPPAAEPRDGAAATPPSGLPDAGSGGLLSMSGAEPVAYGAIVMGLLTLGFAFFLRRVAGRSGMRRGEG